MCSLHFVVPPLSSCQQSRRRPTSSQLSLSSGKKLKGENKVKAYLLLQFRPVEDVVVGVTLCAHENAKHLSQVHIVGRLVEAQPTAVVEVHDELRGKSLQELLSYLTVSVRTVRSPCTVDRPVSSSSFQRFSRTSASSLPPSAPATVASRCKENLSLRFFSTPAGIKRTVGSRVGRSRVIPCRHADCK